jgi:site-specific recombinase XerD
MPAWGTYGAVHVRYGKSSRGSAPRRRTVLAVPEFDWVVQGLAQCVEQVRPLLHPGSRPELWLTERGARIAVKSMDRRFALLRTAAGLPAELTLHCLRHSYVTHLVEFGYPERFVTEQVGHSYASTTAIYTSVSDDFKTKTLQSALRRVYGQQPDDVLEGR